MPAGGERSRLGLAVADDAEGDEVRIVERGAVGVTDGVPELAALVDGPRRLRRDVAADAAREGELAEQLADAVLVAGDVREVLGICPLEVRIGDGRRPAVPRSDDVDRVEIAGLDDPVQVRVDEVQAGRRAPVAEQAGLDMVAAQRLAEQGIVEQVDLADG